MATSTGKPRCITCGKEKAIMKCGGCSQDFCFNHITDHRQELSKALDEIEVNRDLFRQTLTQQTRDPKKHALIQQVDQWERDSINDIRKTAEEARQLLLAHTAEYLNEIEIKLNKLTNQLRESRQENDFYETDLRQWSEELTRLTNELHKPANINLRQDTPLINKISVNVISVSINNKNLCLLAAQLCIPNIGINAKWKPNGITVAGGNGAGDGVNQLSSPLGLYIDDDESVYVVDRYNYRIVKWKSGATSGEVVAGGNGNGQRNDQLSDPKDVVVDKENDSFIISDQDNHRVVRWSRRNGKSVQTIISNVNCYGLTLDDEGYLYVCDASKHEVRRWKIGNTIGTVVAGGNGQGNSLNQLNHPYYIVVDQDHSVYVSDQNNNRVMKWIKDAKEGIVVAGGQGAGSTLTQLSSPRGVVVDQSGAVYVADCGNHRVIRWSKGATQGTVVVGENAYKRQSNQLQNPWGLSFDRHGNLYVADYRNHRIQKFNIDS
ncbi:unnamed protein product, partial [Rotaria sp. Silwood1]